MKQYQDQTNYVGSEAKQPAVFNVNDPRLHDQIKALAATKIRHAVRDKNTTRLPEPIT